jgi:hypothetical protein
MVRITFFVCLVLLFFTSCKKKLDNSITYNPLKDTIWNPIYEGYWAEYQIDSVWYKKSSLDTVVTKDQIKYYIKEVISKKIDSFGNQNEYEIDIFYKKEIGDTYRFLRKNSVKRSNTMLIYNRDNLQFINMVFPVEENISWKGNQLIQTTDDKAYLANWQYVYKGVNQPITVFSNNFPQTTKVLKVDDENAIEKLNAYDYFALNIGLIYSKTSNLKKQNVLNDWSQPENGHEVTKQIIDWKK